MKDIYGREMPPSLYEKNDTMKLLGYQCSGIFYNEEVVRQIQQISEARPHSLTINAAADVFLLGYIHGKRAERTRRKKTI